MVASVLAFECVLMGFLYAGKARSKVFTKEFMKENFEKEHAQVNQGQIAPGGYPDMGSGRYSEKLSYKEWYMFNCAQRVHYNFVEMIATYEILLLVGGLAHPLLAAAMGALLIVGRIVYAIGYMFGPKSRVPGALIADVCLLGLTALAFHSSYIVASRRKWF